MAVVSVHTYKTAPGRMADHLELANDARTRLQGLGLSAFTITPLAGDDPTTISTVVNHADNAAYAGALTSIQSDEGWVEFVTRADASGAGEPVETTIYADLDPSFTVPADRAIGALTAFLWRPLPGRLDDFLGHVMTGVGHLERLGGTPRVLRTIIGGEPLTIGVSVVFEDLAHYGEFSDKIDVDEQWNGFWAGVMKDPSADLVRNALYSVQT